MDIKATKSSAGEVFVCFNENSHNYKLFLNLIKGAEGHPDTALRTMAQNLNKVLAEAIIDDKAKGIVAKNVSSDGGLSYTQLTNISNKIDLIFNSLSGLKDIKLDPVETKLDPEIFEVFGKRLEQSLGSLIGTKLQSVSTPILPDNLADQVAKVIGAKQIQCSAETLKPLLTEIQKKLQEMQGTTSNISTTYGTLLATLDKRETIILEEMHKLQEQLSQSNIRSETENKIMHMSIDPVSVATNKPQDVTEAKQLPSVTIQTNEGEKAFPCSDGKMRYPAPKKKTQPNCFGNFLDGSVNETPCLSCAWVNDCKKNKKTDIVAKQPDTDKPVCYGHYKGDLDCSMCRFDAECNEKTS